MNRICRRCSLLALGLLSGGLARLPAGTFSTLYGTSYQINVNAANQNIVGDAANEPSFCVDPTNPRRMAVGWRQFDSVASDFRQAGWAYSTNGGLNWTFPGVLTPGVFRSDPVLAADGDGRFYYLSLLVSPNYHCELWRSTNGGVSWTNLGSAYGGDKAWMTIDTTSGLGRGNIYQACSPWANSSGVQTGMFTRSTTGGLNWMTPIGVPLFPFWGTLDVGPNGELFVVGSDNVNFTVNRSTNAQNPSVTPVFELTRTVNLGGALLFQVPGVNPVGLIGQPWIVADKSTGPTRGNVYLLCSVSSTGNPVNVMFARSTNGGSTWSSAQRINDDPPGQNAYHWFGTLSVAPNGRIDACWNDTRNSSDNTFSELYYTWSDDGGLTWSPNRPLSPPFDHTLGYPVQQKMGDYIGMVSLNEGACIAYTATFNGEEDLYFVRAELPITVNITRMATDSLPGSWEVVDCILTNGTTGLDDHITTVSSAVIVSNATRILYYGAWKNGGGTATNGAVCAAVSVDNTWTNGLVKLTAPVLTRGASGQWDSGYVSGPRVFQENGTNYLFYFGGTNTSFEAFPSMVGLAEGTDGTNFTKHSGNPVMTIGAPGAIDDTTLFTFTVRKTAGTYYAFYNCYDGSQHETISLATATDIHGPWTKHGASVVMNAPGTGGFAVASDPNVFPLTGSGWGMIYRMWTTNNLSALAEAYSDDLTNWINLGEIPYVSTITPSPTTEPGGGLYGTWLLVDNGQPYVIADDLGKFFLLQPRAEPYRYVARISWNSVPGGSYCVQAKDSLSLPWSSGTNVACVVATDSVASVDDAFVGGGAQRFYRVVRQP